jgi:hypothetical protein
VKDEHQHPIGFIQPLPLLEWIQWMVIIINCITGLLNTVKQHNTIVVVVDKLTKDNHFITIKSNHKETQIFVREIFRLHGMPITIVLDRDSNFTLNFWKNILKAWEPILISILLTIHK